MAKKLLLILTLFGALLFIGCRTNPWMENYRTTPLIQYAQLNSESQEFKALYADATTDKDARNRFVARLILSSDNTYDAYKANVEANKVVFELATKGTTSLLLGIGTVVEGPLASMLAAGAGFSDSINALGNKEIFYQKITIAIFGRIDSTREKMRKEIMENMAKSVSEYPVDVAILDISEYHSTGSLLRGLELLMK